MNLIGYGESSCFSNNPNPALTQECQNEDDYCITDLKADWFLNGRQEYRIRMGCSEKVYLKNTPVTDRHNSVDNLVIVFFLETHPIYSFSFQPIHEGCLEGSASNDQMLYKDCTKTCFESFCNNDFDSVAELFSTGRDLTCYSCKYLEYFDGAAESSVRR